ncbi:MAG: acyltransferase [Lachnospiraceae bacterium]|nr:acyltransferase [Lachnospiraceae bacterium]
MLQKKQNYYLNFWKGLACFGVVFFHTRFPVYTLDGILQSFFRAAIPLFFMVSGYFCYGEDRGVVEKKLPAKIKRIFWINLGGCLYYFVMQLSIAVFGDSHGSMADVIERFQMMFNKETMVNWLVFNQDPFVHIMWFTSALLYCYLLFWIINHFNLYQVSYGLIPVLIVIHLVLGNVLVLFGIEITKIFYRNFLLFGFPFFMLGNWLHKHQKGILEKLTEEKCKLIFLPGLVLGVVEWFLMGRHEMYIGSLLIVISVFGLSLHQPEKKKNSFITKIGTEYSLFIYIVHYSLMLVMERFAEKVIIPGSKAYYVYYFARPFVIFGICLMGAWIFYKLLSVIKNRRKK